MWFEDFETDSSLATFLYGVSGAQAVSSNVACLLGAKLRPVHPALDLSQLPRLQFPWETSAPHVLSKAQLSIRKGFACQDYSDNFNPNRLRGVRNKDARFSLIGRLAKQQNIDSQRVLIHDRDGDYSRGGGADMMVGTLGGAPLTLALLPSLFLLLHQSQALPPP